VYLRGKATEPLESLYCAPGFGTHARGRMTRVFVAERGKPRSTAKPDCSVRGVFALYRTLAEAAVRYGPQSRMTVDTRTSSQRASPDPGPKLGDGRFLDALISAEADIAAAR
jgi:hypothetical protein